MEATWSQGAVEVKQSKAACDKIASPLGSNSFPGTAAKPYATVEKLAGALLPGQTGCLHAGVYERDVKLARGGTVVAPITLTSFPGERATVLGRLHVSDAASNVVIQQLDLDGRNDANLPSPTVNGDNVAFRDNDVTNRQTSICFLLGSTEYGEARGTVLERNRIHNCGELPPTNHHHGIYIELSNGARITDNWIYDNADRGIQLFPDAKNTYMARNVIDGNGQGVVFSRGSSNNILEHNFISNPAVRYNLEDFELSGTGNVARLNCLWSTRHPGNAGIQPGIAVPLVENFVLPPMYASRETKDFRLPPGTPCLNFSSRPGPPPRPRRKSRHPVRLRASAAEMWPGGRLRLRADVKSANASATKSKYAVLKIRHDGIWRTVGVMRLRGGSSYAATLRLGKVVRKALRQFGRTHIGRGPQTLRLRAYVRGAGRSNIVVVRIAGTRTERKAPHSAPAAH